MDCGCDSLFASPQLCSTLLPYSVPKGLSQSTVNCILPSPPVPPPPTAPLPCGFQLGLANGKHRQEIRGWEESEVGLFLPSSLYGLSYFGGTKVISLHDCSPCRQTCLHRLQLTLGTLFSSLILNLPS